MKYNHIYASSNANLWNSDVSASNTTDTDATAKTISDRNIYFPVSNKLGSADGNIDTSDGCGFCWGSTLNMTSYSIAVGFKYGEGEYNYDQDMKLQVGAGYPVRPVVESSNE